ncbi:MAG TPA: alanine racemase [Gemmatimonadaceae bacterium]|jgi:D-serine deaminase-like pyridoxal phosphate-dependent protein|nr:alanine racemase [Gemmatimonadaceae bacterium]
MTDDMPQQLTALETPAVLVDLDRLDRNLARAADYAANHGLALRPHVKTHKSPFVAEAQLRLGACGLTCATPREAEVMSEVSDDLLVAYPPIGGPRARRLAALPSSVRLTIALDSEDAAIELARAARDARREVAVYVELDLGMHRVGTATVDAAVALARRVSESEGLRFDGIAFYPGHVREPISEQDVQLRALDLALSRAIERFHDAGLPPRVVSGGSTPTLWRTHELPGVTEMRPGTYAFNDRGALASGACEWDDCALTVLATVVSTAVPGQAVIDAGTKALGREPVRGAEGEGFAQLLEHPEVLVSRMSEEHGILDLSRTAWRPVIGEVVRVVPNHVCVVVHLNDVAYGIRGERLERKWPIAARGREASSQ